MHQRREALRGINLSTFAASDEPCTTTDRNYRWRWIAVDRFAWHCGLDCPCPCCSSFSTHIEALSSRIKIHFRSLSTRPSLQFHLFHTSNYYSLLDENIVSASKHWLRVLGCWFGEIVWLLLLNIIVPHKFSTYEPSDDIVYAFLRFSVHRNQHSLGTLLTSPSSRKP